MGVEIDAKPTRYASEETVIYPGFKGSRCVIPTDERAHDRPRHRSYRKPEMIDLQHLCDMQPVNSYATQNTWLSTAGNATHIDYTVQAQGGKRLRPRCVLPHAELYAAIR